MKADTKIKMGILKDGTHVRVVAEMDLIEQDVIVRDKAIYLSSVTVVRDPRIEFTDEDVAEMIKVVETNFKTHRFDFKAKDRTEADIFLKQEIKEKWEVVREFSEI